MSIPSRTPGEHITGIDGLRTLAVLAVLIYHVVPHWLPSGFVGVDVFFVISGFVVARSLGSRPIGTGIASFLRDFYARRLVRLYPALVLCLLVTVLAQTLFVPSAWLSDAAGQTARYAFWGLSNFALVGTDDGYFAPRSEYNPFTHTWSLAVEEQFYLLFPLLAFCAHAQAKRPLLSKWASWALVALAVSSLAWCAWQTPREPSRAYYMLASRFWELAAGAGLAWWLQRRPASHGAQAAHPALRVWASLAGLVAVCVSMWWVPPGQFPFPWAILPVLGTVLLLWRLASSESPSELAWLSWRPMTAIGAWSYAIYLWHWPLLVLMKWTVGLAHTWAIAMALVLPVALGAASYRLVEQPAQRWARGSGLPSGRLVLRGLMWIALATLVAAAVLRLDKWMSLSVTRDQRTWQPKAWPQPADPGLRAWSHHRLLVLGDSHALAYGTVLQMLRDRDGLEVQVHSKPGCAVANLLTPSSAACSTFIDATLKAWAATPHPAGTVVLLASLRSHRLSNQWGTFSEQALKAATQGPQAAQARAAALDEAAQLLARLHAMGLTVVMDAPKPVFAAPAFRCSDWFNAGNPSCAGGLSWPRERMLAHREQTMRDLQSLQRQQPGLRVWDPLPVLCPTQTCQAVTPQGPLFFDGDHLSAHGNRVLYPSLRLQLADIWSAGCARNASANCSASGPNP